MPQLSSLLSRGEGAYCADELNSIKRRLMMKAITIPGLNALKHAYRRGKVVAMPFLVNHLVEWRYLEAGAVTSQWVEDDDPPDSVNEIEVIYSLTQRGRSLLEKWGLA